MRASGQQRAQYMIICTVRQKAARRLDFIGVAFLCKYARRVSSGPDFIENLGLSVMQSVVMQNKL